MVVIYSQDGIKLYLLLLTACLKNDFEECIYVFSVCVTLTAKFSIAIERLSRTEWSSALCMISKGRWKFPSSHFQPSPENDGRIFHRHFELQSYTWVFENLEFIFGNLTKPLSILHFLILLKRCWKFSWLFWVRLKIFGIFPRSLLNCTTFCLKRMEIGTICIKKGIYHRTSPVHGNILKFHSR